MRPVHPKNESPKTPGLKRRQVLQAAAAATLPALSGQVAHAAIVGNANKASWAGVTDPTIYAQAYSRRFTNVLLNPLDKTALGGVGMVMRPDTGTTTQYTVWANQTTQAVLGIPGVNTTIWGYHNSETVATYPGRTLEVTQGTAITVRWGNDLRTTAGPLPHLFAVDQTISIQTPTTGVPLAVHHHGGDTAAPFDGTPDQWTTPRRAQIGPGIAADNSLGQLTLDQPMLNAQYANTQEASLHWYHDHAESITRTNVYAGLAGLYVVRDANETQIRAKNLIPQAQYEVALVLQDRTFDAKGNFTYTANPADYPGGPPVGLPAGGPTHMPEQFGDVICVNGKAWPVMNVEARSYRVRLLNGSDSRFFPLEFGSNTGVYQIGTDLGFLNNGVRLSTVTIAPGERIDLVVDFSLYAGKNPDISQPQVNVDVINTAPTPFPGGTAPTGGARLVMRFAVNQLYKRSVLDPAAWLIPTYSLRQLVPALPAAPAVPAKVRRILLAEGVDTYGRITPLLGVYDPSVAANNKGTLSLHDPITETPTLNTSEVWEFWNISVDSHPVHLHLVEFRVLNRQGFTGTVAGTVMSNGWQGAKLMPGAKLVGTAATPPAQERGLKDTVVCPPGQITRVVVTFKRRGVYVYHCHILSHEEHDMMRYYKVV